MSNKNCKYCDVIFTAKNQRSLYCSVKCKNKLKSETIMAKRRDNISSYNTYQRAWRSKNKEHCSQWERNRYVINTEIREKKKSSATQWARDNPERKTENQRKYYQDHWFEFQARNFARRDRTLSADLVREVMENDNYTCQYCHKRGGKLTIDHQLPVSRGGTDDRKNLCTACHRCNCRKGAKTVSEFQEYLTRC